jgi:hypothetical protein
MKTEAIEAQIESTHLVQLFLTVQPCANNMSELDTHLQPHFDPSDLTINLHFSDLEFRGAKREENGLLIFDPSLKVDGQSPKLVSTPQGTAVFIWADKNGEHKCLHTANNLSRGSRAVLCSFWRYKSQKCAEGSSGTNAVVLTPKTADALPLFISPLPLPILSSGRLSSQAIFVAQVDGAVLIDSMRFCLSASVLNAMGQEARALFTNSNDGQQVRFHFVFLLLGSL